MATVTIPEPEFETVTETTGMEVYNNAGASLEQERALIGAILRDGTRFERAAEIAKNDDFLIQQYGFIWKAFEALRARDQKIDTITAGDELERASKLGEIQVDVHVGRMALAKLREQGDPRNVLAYAENVQDYSTKRKALQIMNQGAQWFLGGRRASDALADLYKLLGNVTPYSGADDSTVHVAVGAKEAYDWTVKASQGMILGVQTGFKGLDKMLGCLMKKNVYYLAGRPGTGKTGFLVTAALHAARTGNRVAFFSLEMSRLQVSQRLLSQISGIDLHRIIHGQLEDQEWPILIQATEELANLPIFINDMASLSITKIRRISRKLNSAHPLDLLIVDYLQLAGPEEGIKVERRDLDVSSISRGLLQLARELDLPVMAAAQLSRAVEQRADRKPILSDLRESGSLEQDAYAVMFLYKENQPETQNVTKLLLEKHRNGAVGNVDLLFRASLARFEDCQARTISLRDPSPSWRDRD